MFKVFKSAGEFLRLIKKDRATLVWFSPAAATVLVTWVVWLWKLLPLAGSPLPLPVHYSVLIGIDKVLPWYWTLLSPVLATGALVTNFALALFLRRSTASPLAVFVGVYTAFLEILFLIATVLTVLLNVAV